jgi:hypothetical protein
MLEFDLYYQRFINNERADSICSGDLRSCLLLRFKKKIQWAIYSFVYNNIETIIIASRSQIVFNCLLSLWWILTTAFLSLCNLQNCMHCHSPWRFYFYFVTLKQAANLLFYKLLCILVEIEDFLFLGYC